MSVLATSTFALDLFSATSRGNCDCMRFEEQLPAVVVASAPVSLSTCRLLSTVAAVVVRFGEAVAAAACVRDGAKDGRGSSVGFHVGVGDQLTCSSSVLYH